MIVGHGAIARALTDRDDRLYFASGVADSQETRDEEYGRERALLHSQERFRHIVYFSSLCVFTQDTRYARHKREMEALIRQFPAWTVMRLGNIDWAENPAQLIPFIRRKLRDREPFNIYDEYRHILSKDEFLYWVGLIPPWNCEMNVTGQRLKVADLIARYQGSWH